MDLLDVLFVDVEAGVPLIEVEADCGFVDFCLDAQAFGGGVGAGLGKAGAGFATEGLAVDVGAVVVVDVDDFFWGLLSV